MKNIMNNKTTRITSLSLSLSQAASNPKVL
jgi:hypothetical protein